MRACETGMAASLNCRQSRPEEPVPNMMSNSPRLLVAVAGLLGFAPLALGAQEATNVTGTVTSSQAPLENVAVSIPELRLGGSTDQAGRYRIIVPASATGRTVVLVARRIG